LATVVAFAGTAVRVTAAAIVAVPRTVAALRARGWVRAGMVWAELVAAPDLAHADKYRVPFVVAKEECEAGLVRLGGLGCGPVVRVRRRRNGRLKGCWLCNNGAALTRRGTTAALTVRRRSPQRCGW
jgi:hypothetical protein